MLLIRVSAAPVKSKSLERNQQLLSRVEDPLFTTTSGILVPFDSADTGGGGGVPRLTFVGALPFTTLWYPKEGPVEQVHRRTEGSE